jgi:hypothetical protein
MSARHHEWMWDGRDEAGLRVASGVYFVTLETPTTSQTRKVVVVE